MRAIEITPLRTAIGEALEIAAIKVIATSVASFPQADIVAAVHTRLQDAGAGLPFNNLLPHWLALGPGGSPVAPGPGVTTYPIPTALPFEGDHSFAGVAVLGGPTDLDTARSIWIEFRIELVDKEARIGGICFAGYPFLPYTIDRRGISSSNFGLPREMRLAWGKASDGFIDADDAVTVQRPAAHSGLHVITCGEVRTNELRLRVSDLPRLQLNRSVSAGRVVPQEGVGFVLPYLAVFSYQEGTRYRPTVRGGLLAAFATNTSKTDSPLGTSPLGQGNFPQLPVRAYDGVIATPSGWITMSAASLFGQRRMYAPVPLGTTPSDNELEHFLSEPVNPGQEIRLVIEQTEEHPRCIAGLRFSVPQITLPKIAVGPLPVSLWSLEVFEIDPPDGVSPIDPDRHPRSDRWARKLFEAKEFDLHAEHSLSRFNRTSLCRVFALVFTSRSGQSTRLQLKAIEMLQSANVEIHPRPSRSQSLSSLRLRLIGADLMFDHAKITDMPFALNVEETEAGVPTRELLAASRLLDLLQVDGVRVFANSRIPELRSERSFEDTKIDPVSYDLTKSHARSDGWNRSESGKDVQYVAPPSRVDAQPPTAACGLKGFEVFSNSETRAQLRQLGPQTGLADAVGDSVRSLVTAINARLPTGARSVALPLPPPGTGFELTRGQLPRSAGAITWDQHVWRGGLMTDPAIGALTIVAMPPFVESLIAAATDAANTVRTVHDQLSEGRNPITDPVAAQKMLGAAAPLGKDLLSLLVKSSPFAFINGIGMNLSAGVGVAATAGVNIVGTVTASPSANVGQGLSINCLVPTLTTNVTTGTTGSVAKQASLSGYSYAQHLSQRFDASQVYTQHIEGRMKREVLREVSEREFERGRGVEVRWQNSYADIVICTIALDKQFLATAGRIYHSADPSVRVRLPRGVPDGVSLDVAFVVYEEKVRDDR
jgi:hypothetical protein